MGEPHPGTSEERLHGKMLFIGEFGFQNLLLWCTHVQVSNNTSLIKCVFVGIMVCNNIMCIQLGVFSSLWSMSFDIPKKLIFWQV